MPSRAICRAAPRAASCRRRWPTSRSISARSKPRAASSARRAVVVLSDKDDMKAVALNLLRFFEDESCGQCTPCRAGTEKAVKLMTAPHWDEPLLEELTQVMSDASICGLGQAAMNPVKQVLKHFREDLARHPRPHHPSKSIPAKAGIHSSPTRRRTNGPRPAPGGR